jgi:zinc protease
LTYQIFQNTVKSNDTPFKKYYSIYNNKITYIIGCSEDLTGIRRKLKQKAGAFMVIENTYQFPFLKDKVHLYILDNKHSIITIKKPGEITNISTWVKTGSINENDKNNGVSHFLEHLMFKGTERLKPGEFDRLLESRGGIINAATWKDYTFYYVTIPKGENDENFKLAIDLHADMLLNSILPEEEIGKPYDINDEDFKEKRERSVVIEEISMREDQPWTKTYNALNGMMYKNHPYRRDTIGTREIISSISRDAIMDYYHSWYVPENMITIVVSNHEPEKMLEMVEKHFQFKAVKSSPPSDYIAEEPPTETLNKNITGDINTGFGIAGFHGPKPSNLKESICMEVITISMGEGRSSRLIQNLIEKPDNPIFNMINCVQYQFRDGSNILLQSNFKADKKDEAIKALKDQINNLKDNPITKAELEKARKKLESRFAETAETASGIAESVGYAIVLTNGLTMYTEYLETLKEITLDDLKDVVNKYLDLNKMCIATMTPQ